ncbi:MAG: hypothetical protein RLO51_05520 [Thalassobaculum sp.]|uniref:hypothetical protein n=1 Tax=Thalassobaculum sp. TaxID=2022740 RepID=UPI0032F0786F
MQIDTRFPAVQATQGLGARDGEAPDPAPASPAGAGSETEFYISPVLRFDSRSLTVIFQVRDSGSGDVVRQFPPETVVERYRQDPTAKPFVLSPRSAAGDGEPGAAATDGLAPFPRSGEGAVDQPDANSAAASGAGAPSDGEQVDLVA